MKRLFLIRHATALPRDNGVPDFERSLIAKGVKEAKKIARRIGKNGQIEGVIISSPANRALETAHIFAKVWDYPVQKIVIKKELYDFSDAREFWPMIKSFENNWDTAVLFGHDPSISDLAQSLAKGFKEVLPKSGAVGFSWNVDSWTEVTPQTGRLILLEFPKAGYAPEKIRKSARKELAAALSENIGTLLAEIDSEGAGSIKKRIRKISQVLASNFLDKAKNRDVVLSYWLRSRQKDSSSGDNNEN